MYYLPEKCSSVYCQELEWLIDDVQGRTKVRQCPCVWKICCSVCERMSACVSVCVCACAGGGYCIHTLTEKRSAMGACCFKTENDRHEMCCWRVYCAGKQNKQWRETAVPTVCLSCKSLRVKVLSARVNPPPPPPTHTHTHTDCENCSVSDIYIHKQQSLWIQRTAVMMITHTHAQANVHTLGLDSPVYRISVDLPVTRINTNPHAQSFFENCTVSEFRNTNSNQTESHLHQTVTRMHAHMHARTHTHTASMRIASSPVHTHNWQSVWILYTPVSHEDVCVHTHTHSFCKNCIVSSSYTQMAISLDPVYTSQSWGWVCVHTHTHTHTRTHTQNFCKNWTVSGSYKQQSVWIL